MKRISMIALLVLTALVPGVGVGAQEATPTASTKQIDDLKERLATKVAELRKLTRKAIFGTVKTVSISTATVETATKDIKIELTDDIVIAQVLKGKRTKLNIEDLAKGDVVAVFGEYDATIDLLKAKAIFIQSAPPQRVVGTVAAVDTTVFTITVKTSEGREVILDIEKATKISLWDKEHGITKGGFSKISVGDSVRVVGTPVLKKENRLSAIRMLDMGNITSVPASTPMPTATPPAKQDLMPEDTPTPTP